MISKDTNWDDVPLDEQLKLTRMALERLRSTYRFGVILVTLVIVSLLGVVILGILGFMNAQDDRDEIQESACKTAQLATQRGRDANAIIVDTFASVLVDPNDPEDVATLEQVRAEIARQQEERLALPICE